MTNRRAASFVIVGIVLGSAVTGLLFHTFSKHPEEKKIGQNIADAHMDSGVSDEEDVTRQAQVERDISGNCILKGTVQDSQGLGIKDALVGVRLLDEPWLSSNLPLREKTEKTGRYKIEGLDEKLEYQIWAWAPGRSVSSHVGVLCGAETDMVLNKGTTLELSFTKPNGDPAGPVQFQLAGSTLWPARQTQTDDSGAVTITGLEPGDYVLWASADRFAYVSDDPIRMELDKETVAEIELVQAGEFRVTVVDSSGKPLPRDATVLVGPSSSSLLHHVVSLDRNGEAIVSGVPPGTYSVSVLADKHVQKEPVVLQPGDDVTIRLELGATVSGLVRTAEGQVISGASVTVERRLGSSLVTAPAGRGRSFRERILEAERAGWPRLHEVPGMKYIPGPLHMPLPKPQFDTPSKYTQAWQPTDSSGRFLLDSLPSGRIALSATHPEYVLLKAAELTLERGVAATEVVVLMRLGTTLTVRTVGEKGYPVPDVEISVFSFDDKLLASTISQSDGFATLIGLPGTFKIEAVAVERVPASAEVKGKIGATKELEITLPPADRIMYGRVLNQSGFGVPGATVTARSMAKNLIQVLTQQTKADGTFSFEGVGSGSYLVAAYAEKQGRAQVGSAHFDEEIKLVLTSGNDKNSEFVTPESFAESLGTPKPIEAQYHADNLGTTEPIGQTEQEHSPMPEATDSFETEFGRVETLPVTGPPSGKGGLPITIGGGSGRAVVKRVQSGSRVAVAGLSEGDRIVAVDGKKIAGPAAARKAIAGPIGSVVMLKIESGDGEIFNVVVQRVRVK
ncbi:MAG: hypothetical protein GY847_30705 [Proteobacteria bacterium]|nr:hypothetical protein [Pseudomonadota bacterium]